MMNHRVAIWAEWYEVLDRINDVVVIKLAYRHHMVYMDEPLGQRSVHFAKIHPACLALTSIVVDASLTVPRITLIFVYDNGFFRPFGVSSHIIINRFSAIQTGKNIGFDIFAKARES